ncbi:unnamed protein product [marine sediment metagenome]|uniref:Uncharacterized protein n=1 Tax=marine sediment metagenome TaxID=412755 RepID=X1Q1S4_9ZZZZ
MNERMLPELMPGDLFATPPADPLARFTSDLLNAQTFHWVLVVHPVLIDSRVDYEIMEAIPTKGVAVGLLSQMYGDVPIRVYRVKALSRPDERQVERVADSYGRSFYAFTTLPSIITWWVSSHFIRFLDSQPPALDLNSALCTGFVTMVWKDLGVELVPPGVYPTPDMLEKSPSLEIIYSEF